MNIAMKLRFALAVLAIALPSTVAFALGWDYSAPITGWIQYFEYGDENRGGALLLSRAGQEVHAVAAASHDISSGTPSTRLRLHLFCDTPAGKVTRVSEFTLYQYDQVVARCHSNETLTAAHASAL